MSKQNDGGPAFPFAGETGHHLNDSVMTLRDYFAAKAMQGMLAGAMADGTAFDASAITHLSESAYLVSDAMLSAREAKP